MDPASRLPTAVCCILILVFCLPLVSASPAEEVDTRPLDVRVQQAFARLEWPDYVTGLDDGKARNVRPIIVTGAGDGTNRVFVATQRGTIHVWPNDDHVDQMQLFLDLTDRVDGNIEADNEEGFLGLAFSPHYADDGQFYVYYTAKPTERTPHLSILSRFRRSDDDPNRADPDSEEVLMEIPQPFGNHNGGTVVFGPDGYLYVVLGDGGLRNDTLMHAQNLHTLLGSILRIDVSRADPDHDRPYAIPPDNPFVEYEGFARPEIWAYGLRNVWRLTFDRATGTAWAGDVGQDEWEEIDIIVRGGNYGWNLREGKHKFGPAGSEACRELIEPIWEYHHDVGKSITGGYVYRGQQVPELEGAYLYGDWVTGQVWALRYDHQQERVTANRTILPKGLPVITFGEDDAGEVYFTTQDGKIHRFVSPE